MEPRPDRVNQIRTRVRDYRSVSGSPPPWRARPASPQRGASSMRCARRPEAAVLPLLAGHRGGQEPLLLHASGDWPVALGRAGARLAGAARGARRSRRKGAGACRAHRARGVLRSAITASPLAPWPAHSACALLARFIRPHRGPPRQVHASPTSGSGRRKPRSTGSCRNSSRPSSHTSRRKPARACRGSSKTSSRRTWNAASWPTASCVCVVPSAHRRSWWRSVVSQRFQRRAS